MALLPVVQVIAKVRQLGILRLDDGAVGFVAFNQFFKLFCKTSTGAAFGSDALIALAMALTKKHDTQLGERSHIAALKDFLGAYSMSAVAADSVSQVPRQRPVIGF